MTLFFFKSLNAFLIYSQITVAECRTQDKSARVGPRRSGIWGGGGAGEWLDARTAELCGARGSCPDSLPAGTALFTVFYNYYIWQCFTHGAHYIPYICS